MPWLLHGNKRIDLDEVRAIAEQVRADYEASCVQGPVEFDVKEAPDNVGLGRDPELLPEDPDRKYVGCVNASMILAKSLEAAGYKPSVIRGLFWQGPEHSWVELGKHIIDISADQFDWMLHEESAPRSQARRFPKVMITDVNDPLYLAHSVSYANGKSLGIEDPPPERQEDVLGPEYPRPSRQKTRPYLDEQLQLIKKRVERLPRP